MIKLVLLSCALTVSHGNYAGNKDPIGGGPSHSIPKILNPNNPIDPNNVRNVGPGLRPGDVIHSGVIDNNERLPLGNPWMDDPRGRDPWANGQTVRIPGSQIDANTGSDGQVFVNPFNDRPGSPIHPIQQKPTYDNSAKVVPNTDPFVPGIGEEIFNPFNPNDPLRERPVITGHGSPINPNRKKPSYDNSHKLPVPPVGNPSGYDGSAKIIPDITPFVPGLGGETFNPFNPNDPLRREPFNDGPGSIIKPIRRKPSYDNSHKLPVPPVKNPSGYDGSAKIIPDITPFVPGLGGETFNPFNPNDPLRREPFNDGPGSIIKPIRRKPSYDNSHKLPVPPVKNPSGYDGSAKIIQDNVPFVPGVDGEIFNPGNPGDPFVGGPFNNGPGSIISPIRKKPSYDNSHKLPASPVNDPFNRQVNIIPDDTQFVPGIGGEIFEPNNPIHPIRKAPSYDNSHKIGPGGSPLRPGDILPPVRGPGGSPRRPGDILTPGIPVRKAPSYDNSHKVVGGVGDVLPPRILGPPFVGAPQPDGIRGSGVGINAHSIDAQRQWFDKAVSDRLGARSDISPQVLPVKKGLSTGKRNYLASLGVFKKAKSYQS